MLLHDGIDLHGVDARFVDDGSGVDELRILRRGAAACAATARR